MQILGHTRVRRGLVAAAAIVTMIVSGGTSASAAPAVASAPAKKVTNGPISITFPTHASFVTGSQTVLYDLCGFPQPDVFTKAQLSATWSATSTAGPIVGYTIYDVTGEGNFLATTTTTATYSEVVDNYNSDCGGGAFSTIGFLVVAKDSAGHKVKATIDAGLQVTRWDNTGPNGPFGTWSFTGTWATSTCACADGGNQRFTTGAGASASFALTATAGERVALLMPEGPGRGSAGVYVDGVLKATLDTHAAANTNRIVVWSSGGLSAGAHVIKVVNSATVGHPRIDINAALTD